MRQDHSPASPCTARRFTRAPHGWFRPYAQCNGALGAGHLLPALLAEWAADKRDLDYCVHSMPKRRGFKRAQPALNPRLQLDPSDIRYSQATISPVFDRSAPTALQRHGERGAGQPLAEVLAQLTSGELVCGDFPVIRVVRHGDQLYSLDNRRLWLFRAAGVASVQAELVSRLPCTFHMHLLRWCATSAGTSLADAPGMHAGAHQRRLLSEAHNTRLRPKHHLQGHGRAGGPPVAGRHRVALEPGRRRVQLQHVCAQGGCAQLAAGNDRLFGPVCARGWGVQQPERGAMPRRAARRCSRCPTPSARSATTQQPSRGRCWRKSEPGCSRRWSSWARQPCTRSASTRWAAGGAAEGSSMHARAGAA